MFLLQPIHLLLVLIAALAMHYLWERWRDHQRPM